jgi:hypothetical protein
MPRFRNKKIRRYSDFNKVSAPATTTPKVAVDYKKKGIDENLQSMGYGGLEDFYIKNPQLKDVRSESMLTTGLRKVKNIVKRYIK